VKPLPRFGGSDQRIGRKRMEKPPPSGPRSDIHGVNRDARTGAPNRDPAKGIAEDKHEAEQGSKGLPDDAGMESPN
jgi:hypothetical protein